MKNGQIAVGFLVLLVLSIPITAGEEGAQVTVLDFLGREEPWIGTAIALRLEQGLLAEAGIRVLDREHLDALVREAGLSDSGLVSRESRQVLRAAAVDRLVTGIYRVEGGRLTITARVIRADTGETAAEVKVEGPRESVAELAAQLVPRLIEGIRNGGQLPPGRVLGRLPPLTLSELKALATARRGEASGDYSAAYVALRRGLSESPESGALGTALGRLLLRMDEPLHATLAFREVLKGRSLHWTSEALGEMARLLEHELSRPELAARAYREIVSRFSNVEEADRYRYREVQLLERAGRRRDACAAISDHLEHLREKLRRQKSRSRFQNRAVALFDNKIRLLQEVHRDRWVALPPAERESLAVPSLVRVLEGDDPVLRVSLKDPTVLSLNGGLRITVVAPEGRFLTGAGIVTRSGPREGPQNPASLGWGGVTVSVGRVRLEFDEEGEGERRDEGRVDLPGALPPREGLCRRHEPGAPGPGVAVHDHGGVHRCPCEDEIRPGRRSHRGDHHRWNEHSRHHPVGE